MKSLPLLAFIALGFAWGISYGLTNVAVREIRPFPLVGVRTFFGVLFLAVYVLRQRPPRPPRGLDWVLLMVPGVLGTAIPLLLIAWSQQYVDSTLAAIIVTSTPIFTLVIAHASLGDERITVRRLTGVLVGFGGVVVLLSRGLGGTAETAGWATLALVLVAFCYASSSVFARRFTVQHAPSLQALVGQCTALAVVGAITPFTEDAFLVPIQLQTWASLVTLGIFSTGLGYLLFFYLIGTIGPTRAQMINYMILVNGVLLGVFVLGETLTWQMLAGSVLIVFGLAVVNWPLRHKARPTAST